MAQDQYNREITAGNNVIFPARILSSHRDGMSYGRVIDINGNSVKVNTDEGDLWFNSKDLEIQ